MLVAMDGTNEMERMRLPNSTRLIWSHKPVNEFAPRRKAYGVPSPANPTGQACYRGLYWPIVLPATSKQFAWRVANLGVHFIRELERKIGALTILLIHG